MASKWNPNGPGVAGLEWPGAQFNTVGLSQATAYGAAIDSTVSQTVQSVDTLLIPAGGIVQPLVQCDVYDLANPVHAAQSLVLAKPVANTSVGADWQKFTFGGGYSAYASDAYQAVDDIVSLADQLSTGLTDQLIYAGVNPASPSIIMFKAGNSNFWDGNTGAAGAVLGSRRCCWVEVVATVQNRTTHSVRVDGYLQSGTTIAGSQSGPVVVGPQPSTGYGVERVSFGFYMNPLSGGLSWNQVDAAFLTDGSANSFGIGVTTKSGAGEFAIVSLSLQFHVCLETRDRVGFGFGLTNSPVWAQFAMLSPFDFSTSAWPKVSGHRYLYVFSQIRGGAQVAYITPASTDGQAETPLTGTHTAGVTLGPGLVPSQAQVEAQGQFPLLLEVSGVASVDSNPYVSVVETKLGADGSATATQGISSESAQSYGILTVLAGVTSDGAGGAVQNQPMTVTLKRTSDNATMLGPFTVLPTDIPADGKYHIVRVRGTAVALSAAQAVYIECASTSTVGWKLPAIYTRQGTMLATDAKAVLANAVTQGGTADRASGDNGADFPSWTIGVVPATPTGLTVTQGSKTLSPSPPGGPAVLHWAQVDWTSTTLGAAFGYYELQRFHQTTGWNTIAYVTSEASSYFNDLELQRNTSQAYRLRVVRADANFSDWTTQVAATITTPLDCDVILASNYRPDLAIAYQESGNASPVRTYTRRSAANAVIHEIVGRQAPVGFRPAIEGNADVHTRTFITAGQTSATDTVANTEIDSWAFKPLLALIESTVPYVALLDGRGLRWYTFPEFLGGSYDWRAFVHKADVRFTDTAYIPTPLTTATPPVP